MNNTPLKNESQTKQDRKVWDSLSPLPQIKQSTQTKKGTTMYKIHDFMKTACIDTYDEGEQKGQSIYDVDISVVADTTEEMIKKIIEEFNVTVDDLEFEGGTVNISRHECEDGSQPSLSELEAWKAGNHTLWSVRYSGQLNHITEASF